MRTARFDRNKFKELILYIALKSGDDPKFGAVKLNKLLYYADFEAYRTLGRSITGADYQHIEEGPAPRALLPVKRDLISDGDAHEITKPYYGREQSRLVADREPNTDIFKSEELKLIDAIVEGFKNYSGLEITDQSHKELGWRLTEHGESIPYSSAWFSPAPLTMEEIQIGREIAKQHGLLAEPL